MGQYHSIFNLDKKSTYSPRPLGSGVKLMEQALSTGPCAALLALLADDAHWRGDRIAVMGDYAEPADLSGDAATVYAEADFAEYDADVRKALTDGGIAEFTTEQVMPQWSREVCTLTDRTPGADDPQIVVFNHDRGEYLAPRGMGDDGTLIGTINTGADGGTATGLYVLLAASCKGGARGGGDIHSSTPLVGQWAGDHISVLPAAEVADGAVDITAGIREVLTEAGEVNFTVGDDGAVTDRKFAWV